jgi:serine/threonine-protein kinase
MSTPSNAALPRLGRYELIAGIASGGMGSVVLARLAGVGGFQRLVAIKLLHRHFLNDEEFISMLLDEARIAARIHNPNVVSIQEIVESQEHGYYLVMDYVEGFPLSDVLPMLNGLPWATRWRIVNRVVLDSLHGLHAAHTLNDDHGRPLQVVHRDMSPQNILVSVEGIARVTDFGIAKAASRFAQTKAGSVKGKLSYMAPEQARGRSVDARADLFSLGIVLWESLVGQRLFRAANELDTFKRIMSGRIPWLREIAPEMPESLDAFVIRALERDVDRRFASAREMAAALERAARPHDLVADAIEVGEWVRSTFADKLEERHAAIRQTSRDTMISGSVPMLSRADGSKEKATVSLRVTSGGGDVVTEQDEMPDEDSAWDRAPTAAMDTENAPDELKAAIAAFQAAMGAPQPAAAPNVRRTTSAPDTSRAMGVRTSIPGVAIAKAPGSRTSTAGMPPTQAMRTSTAGTPPTQAMRTSTAGTPPAQAPRDQAPPMSQTSSGAYASSPNAQQAAPQPRSPNVAHQPAAPNAGMPPGPMAYGANVSMDEMPTTAIPTGDHSSNAVRVPPKSPLAMTTPYVYPTRPEPAKTEPARKGAGRTVMILLIVAILAAAALVGAALFARSRGIRLNLPGLTRLVPDATSARTSTARIA